MRPHALCFLLFSAALGAQHVSPAHFAAAEGISDNVFPFGDTTVPFRYSQIHDGVPPMLVSGMAFRHDLAAGLFPSHSVTIDAWVSTAALPAAAMDPLFDSNHGTDRAQVIFGRAYTHPTSNPATVPGGFVLDYPFDAPFLFTGGSLCWEVRVTAKTQTSNIRYDAAAASGPAAANPALAITRLGMGCHQSTQPWLPMSATGGQFVDWIAGAATAITMGANLAPNGVSIFCWGLDTTSLGGIPLPAEIPGSGLAPSGSCTVHHDVTVATFATNSPTGTAASALSFVPSPPLHGLNLFSQVWALDTAANAFGLVTSNAVLHHIIAPFPTPLPLSRMWLSGSLGPTASTMAGRGNGLVTKFY